MTWRAILALAFCAVALPAASQPALPTETVTAYGTVSLPGFWKIAIPSSAIKRSRAGTDEASMGEIVDGSGFLQDHHILFGPPRDQLCRIGAAGDGGALAAWCISFGGPQGAAVEAGGKTLSLAWSAGRGVKLTLRGTLNNAQGFGAEFLFEQDRETYRDGDRLAGSKFDLARSGEDSGGMSVMLAGTLAALSLGDAALLQAQAPDVAAPPQELLAALGGVVSTAWLGRAPRLRDPKLADFFEVYAVEFANGERLCGIHQGPYGKVDGLVCV